MILKDSLELKKKKLLTFFKIQNGGEFQDGRQTIKCSGFVKNNANILQLRILKDKSIQKFHTTIFF
jgi:hypothetical protein